MIGLYIIYLERRKDMKQESGVILEQGDLGMFYEFNKEDKKTYDNKIKKDSEKKEEKEKK